MTFEEMNLPAPINQALVRMKFLQPTAIQAAAIPAIMRGSDLIGISQTGTGKTAAFCIPLITKLAEKNEGKALILVPTRELALQITTVLRQLSSGQPNMNSVVLVGGADMRKQYRELSRPYRIIVATPGRLADHLRRKSVDLKSVQYLVLDEGDRMLDMGFETQIKEILTFVSPTRQTLLFTATLPERILKLVKNYMSNPQRISVGQPAKPVDKIKHSIVQTPKSGRNNILLDQLNARTGSVLIFVNTKHGTNRLAGHLEEFGYKVTRIHGGRTQGQRNQALQGFRDGLFRILVATDVAARGLDVPHIAHVINYDLPIDIDDYIHRIGRTARAGAEGEAICFVAPEDHGRWNRISKLYNLGASVGNGKASTGDDRPFAKKRGGGGGGHQQRDHARSHSKDHAKGHAKDHPKSHAKGHTTDRATDPKSERGERRDQHDSKKKTPWFIQKRRKNGRPNKHRGHVSA